MTRLVSRWSLGLRLVHWGFGVAFLGLLGSGLALGNPEWRGIPFLGSKLVREIHLTWAVLLFVLPLLAASWDGFASVANVWREARRLSPRDRAWLAALLLGRRPLPGQGRLNAGQKLNLYGVLLLTLTLAITGTLIAPEAGRPFPQWLRASVYEVHVLLGYATIPLLAGHVFLATLFPPTREALRGIVLGRVRADWAQAHHADWTPDVAATRESASPAPAPESPFPAA